MSPSSRRRFTRVIDWHNYLMELRQQPEGQSINLYGLRQACYREIEQLRKRPLIVYAVQFPVEHPSHAPISLDLYDVDGFTDLAASLPSHRQVDVLIHSPGGSPEATERIVSLLRNHFEQVSFLIPHSAYSAAAMLALSGNEIIMHPSASLGPIDPQINGIPARALRRGFEKAKEALKKEGPEALPAYMPLIEKHSLELLEIWEDSEKLAQELVTQWLQQYMFEGDPAKEEIIQKAVEFFSAYDTHKTHSRPLPFDKVKDYNLNITLAEGELANLMREVYILLNGFFDLTSFVKVYENAEGLSWGRNFEIIYQQPLQQKKA